MKRIRIALILCAMLLLPSTMAANPTTHTCTITTVQRLAAWRYVIQGRCPAARLTFRTTTYRAFRPGDEVSVTGEIDARALIVQRIRLHSTPQR
mgnify:CR=1 FL=1